MKYGIALFLISTNLLSFGVMFLVTPESPYITGFLLFLTYIYGACLVVGSICLGGAITFLVRGSEYHEYIRSNFSPIMLAAAVISFAVFAVLLLQGWSFMTRSISIGFLMVGIILIIPGLAFVLFPKEVEPTVEQPPDIW